MSKGHVTTVGHDTIRGVATTHYRVTMSPAAVVAADQKRFEKLSGALRDAMQKSIDSIAKLRTPIVADVWIDGHDMARRFEMHLPALSVATGSTTITASVSMRMDLYDFGTPVDVQVPPASEVQDMSGLAGMLGGLTTS